MTESGDEGDVVSNDKLVFKGVLLPEAHIQKAQMVAAANGMTFNQWMREVVAKELGLD